MEVIKKEVEVVTTEIVEQIMLTREEAVVVCKLIGRNCSDSILAKGLTSEEAMRLFKLYKDLDRAGIEY